jgi:hypothetical protein
LDNQGFKPIVDRCEELSANHKDYSEFREDYDTFHILLGNKDADTNSITLACGIDAGLVDRYLSVKKPTTGYGKDPATPYREVDFCDSHHIMMSVIIANFKKDYGRIIEIGAGYGNMIRLNEDVLRFDEWIDIDRPFVSDLANWYLRNTMKSVENFAKIKFVSAYDYPEMESDLVIGAHSISELAMDDFMAYYEKIIKKTKYFFYATHKDNCGAEMLAEKLRIISQDFTLVKQVISEGGGVQNNLYQRNEG